MITTLWFKSIGLIHAKRQPLNLKRILTHFLITNKTASVFKYWDSKRLCCQQLLLEISYTFKNVGKQFFFKTKIRFDCRNLIYVVICPTCKEEYIGENGIGNSKLRDGVRIYSRHIRQPEHEKFKVEKHFRTRGKRKFTSVFKIAFKWLRSSTGIMKITL